MKEQLLPMPARKFGRQSIRYAKYLAHNGKTTFRYNGRDYTIRYIPQTSHKFNTVVADGLVAEEKVPVKLLDHDAAVSIDVGAHMGQYTVLLSLLNDCPTIAFEPNRKNRRLLRDILDTNGLDATVREEVVTNKSGPLAFYVDKHYTESHTTTETDGFVEVAKSGIALSEVVEDYDSAFCKIDVEGGEDDIVSDLQRIDTPLSGLIELHPDKLTTATDRVIDCLEERFDTVDLIAESSPNHPDADEIDHDYNRPLYYFA